MGSKSYSKGISWINDCRIPFVDEKVVSKMYNDGYDTFTTYLDRGNVKTDYEIQNNTQGRFPANILVSDDMLNDGVISGENKKWTNNAKIRTSKIYGSGKGLPPQIQTIKTDKGTNSRYYDIDKWFDNLIE